MANKYFTMQELQHMKFYELPNRIYKLILTDIEKHFGFITDRIVEILNNAIVIQLDQFCNIWKYISVIA